MLSLSLALHRYGLNYGINNRYNWAMTFNYREKEVSLHEIFRNITISFLSTILLLIAGNYIYLTMLG